MIDRLDLVLEQLREDQPTDEGFVMRVIADVRSDEQRRSGRRAHRRPMIMGLAAAALVTGGAVAAVVGGNAPDREATQRPTRPTEATTATERVASPDAPSAPVVASKPGVPQPAKTQTAPAGNGFLSDHSSFVIDEETGLRLDTETYTNAFVVGREQRVTLTLTNTGEHPIAITSSKACALQVIAFPNGDGDVRAGLATDPDAYGGRWACAGSDENPRGQTADHKWMLAPGQSRTADAYIALGREGGWSVLGRCRCSYTQVGESTPQPKSDPLSELSGRALPSPLLPERADGENLTTPAIKVRAQA